jgi:tetratricopeptide (TPR) repeat protein
MVQWHLLNAAFMYEDGTVKESEAGSRAALALAQRLGSPMEEALCDLDLSTIIPPESWKEGLVLLERARQIAEEHQFSELKLDTLYNKAVFLCNCGGDLAGADAIAQEAIEASRRVGDFEREATFRGAVIAWISLCSGDLARCAEVLEGQRRYLESHSRAPRPELVGMLGCVSVLRGAGAAGEAQILEALSLLEGARSWYWEVGLHQFLARSLLARGETARAITELELARSLDLRAGPPAVHALFFMQVLGLLVRARREAGQIDRAREHLRELEELAVRFDTDPARAFAWRAKAELLTRRGSQNEAIRLCERAIEVWERLGWQVELAENVQLLAELKARAGRRDDALGNLDRASEIYAKVSAPLEAARVLRRKPELTG